METECMSISIGLSSDPTHWKDGERIAIRLFSADFVGSDARRVSADPVLHRGQWVVRLGPSEKREINHLPISRRGYEVAGSREMTYLFVASQECS